MAAPAAVKRVAIVAADAGNVVRNRRELIERIAADRHAVTVLVPQVGDQEAQIAARLGFALGTFGAAGPGRFMPSNGLENAIHSRLAEIDPHVVLAYGPRVFQATLGGGRRSPRPRMVGLVNRLDAILPNAGRRPNWLALRQLRQTLALADRLVCHNRDDARTLDQLGVLPVDRPVVLVPGAGVDLAHFTAEPLPPIGRGLVVLMIARLDRRAGIQEYAEAADRVVARSPHVRFVLAGLDGVGADALTVDMVERLSRNIEVVFRAPDVRPLLASAHLYVQATWGEGMPRSLLEALAVGRPVIATATPGCRDTIDERINGVLVPPRDGAALAVAIESVLKRPDLMPAMARASRQKAERRFDVEIVTAELMRAMGLLPETK